MENKLNLYVDIHVLQTVPPSCVNRDDTGSPKTAVYGGVSRARVSSQAWKKSVRDYFRQSFLSEQMGVRTKRIVQMVAEEIIALDSSIAPDKAEDKASYALKNAKLKIKNNEKGTDALFFMSKPQAKALAKLAVEDEKNKDSYSNALKGVPSVDMALFGRMVASDPSLNYDAAAQVAHAISTHEVHNEFDYFTAVDDLSPGDNAGAGHVGTVEFNSSTLYRYATVNVLELNKHLPGEASSVTRGFAEAFLAAMPTGKQNSFANRTLPDAVYVCVRTDLPVNLCGAFEKPVQAGTNGYVDASIERLSDYASKIYASFACEPDLSLCVGEGLGEIGKQMPLPQLLCALEADISERLQALGGK